MSTRWADLRTRTISGVVLAAAVLFITWYNPISFYTLLLLAAFIPVVTLAVMLIAVANTVSMATRDRVQEFGILRSIGFKRRNILSLVLGESLTLTVAGGCLGLLVALGLLNLQDQYYGMRGVNMLIHVTPRMP